MAREQYSILTSATSAVIGENSFQKLMMRTIHKIAAVVIKDNKFLVDSLRQAKENMAKDISFLESRFLNREKWQKNIEVLCISSPEYNKEDFIPA